MYKRIDQEQCKAFEASIKAFLNWNIKPLITEIRQPTLLIYGKNDKWIRAWSSSEMYAMLPNGHPPLIVPKVGHNVILRSSGEIATAIEQFYNTISKAQAE